MDWRKSQRVDTILHRPIPEFNAIKANYPLFYHGFSKKVFDDGCGGKTSHLVYFEKPGHCNFEEMHKIGVKAVKNFLLFYAEFVYTYYAPVSSFAQITTKTGALWIAKALSVRLTLYVFPPFACISVFPLPSTRV